MCGIYGAAQLTNFQEGMNQEGRLAPARNIHVWSNISAFYMLEIEGYTSLDILGNWYFNRSGPTNLMEQYFTVPYRFPIDFTPINKV